MSEQPKRSSRLEKIEEAAKHFPVLEAFQAAFDTDEQEVIDKEILRIIEKEFPINHGLDDPWQMAEVGKFRIYQRRMVTELCHRIAIATRAMLTKKGVAKPK